MFKPSQPMMARLRLTTKQVNGGYYKGTRTGSMGYFSPTNPSSYVIDYNKVRTYVVPEGLQEFKLTPFVTKAMAPTTSHYMHTITRNDREVSVEKGFKGEDFLNSWAMSNAEELVAHEREDEETKLRLEKDRVREQTMRKGPISEAEARKRELKTRAKWRRKAKASAKPRKPEKGKVQLSKKDQKMRNETGGKRNVKFARGRKMRDHGGRRQRTTKNTTEAAQ